MLLNVVYDKEQDSW